MPLTSFSTFSTGIVYVHFFLNRTMISMASRYLSFMGQQRWFYCRHYYSSWKKQEAISTEMRVASLTDLTAHDIRNRSFQLLTSKHLQPPSIYIFSITFSFPLSLTHTFFLSLSFSLSTFHLRLKYFFWRENTLSYTLSLPSLSYFLGNVLSINWWVCLCRYSIVFLKYGPSPASFFVYFLSYLLISVFNKQT